MQSDAELVAAFMRRVADLTPEQVEQDSGIHARTIRRWQAGDVRPLRVESRKKVLRYLARPGEERLSPLEATMRAFTTVALSVGPARTEEERRLIRQAISSLEELLRDRPDG